MSIETRLLAPEAEHIAYAAMMLARGQLVAMPTETVYGLAGDATNAGAVASIYAAKGRPSFNPLIVHAADLAGAERIGLFHDQAKRLAEAFWPGALTLVVPARSGAGIAALVTAGLESVALRVPAHPVAQTLLAAFGGVVAAPSANPSGRISPTTAQHVMEGLGGRLAVVLDAGPSEVGLESTIVGWAGDTPVLLRPGGIPVEALAEALGRPLARPDQGATPSAPGMLASHYAPRAAVRLNALAAEGDEYLIGFGPVAGEDTLSKAGDLVQAASRLFEALHRADCAGRPIAVAPIPEYGLGLAINDRLRRAAAPR